MCPGEKNNGDLTPKALALKHGMLMLGTGEDADEKYKLPRWQQKGWDSKWRGYRRVEGSPGIESDFLWRGESKGQEMCTWVSSLRQPTGTCLSSEAEVIIHKAGTSEEGAQGEQWGSGIACKTSLRARDHSLWRGRRGITIELCHLLPEGLY